MSFAKQKADLWLHASLTNAKNENYKDKQKKIAKGVEAMAVNSIYNQAQELVEKILPEIEKKSGIDSKNYKYWHGVFKSLLWAICLSDRNEFLESKNYKLALQLEFMTEHCERLERQFTKYATLEDLFLSSGLDVMAEGISRRARDLLNSKK